MSEQTDEGRPRRPRTGEAGWGRAEDGTPRDQAVGDLLGALTHALLRVFHLAAGAAVAGPTLALRERQASFAVEQWGRYQILRRRLGEIADDPEAAVARYREPIDAFYAAAPAGDWLDAQVFHYLGEAITADFAEILAHVLDEETGAAVQAALSGRDIHAAFALEQITGAFADGGAVVEAQVGALAGKMVGEALSRLREALLGSNALPLVLGGEEKVKDLVLELLARHRERLDRLGIERVE